MTEYSDPPTDARTRRLATDALPLLTHSGLLPLDTNDYPDDPRFAYLLQVTRFLEPHVASPADLVEKARPFFIHKLDYTDSHLLGTNLHASDARALLRLLLDALDAAEQDDPPAHRFRRAVDAAVTSLPLERGAAMALLAVALLGDDIAPSHLFDAASVLGAERVRTRLQAAFLRLSRVAT